MNRMKSKNNGEIATNLAKMWVMDDGYLVPKYQKKTD